MQVVEALLTNRLTGDISKEELASDPYLVAWNFAMPRLCFVLLARKPLIRTYRPSGCIFNA